MYRPDFDQMMQFFRSYREIGGRHDRHTFFDNLHHFFRLTFDASIGGEGDRALAFAAWVRHLGDGLEARRYFHAVDRVDSYT